MASTSTYCVHKLAIIAPTIEFTGTKCTSAATRGELQNANRNLNKNFQKPTNHVERRNPTKRYDSKVQDHNKRNTKPQLLERCLRSRRHPEHNVVEQYVSMGRPSWLKDSVITTSSAAGG